MLTFLRALTTVELNSYITILAPPKHKNPHYSSGAKGKIFTFIATMHIYKCVLQLKAKKQKKKKFILHYFFFIFYSFYVSFSFLRVSLLTASPSLLSSSTDPSFFLHNPFRCFSSVSAQTQITFYSAKQKQKQKV